MSHLHTYAASPVLVVSFSAAGEVEGTTAMEVGAPREGPSEGFSRNPNPVGPVLCGATEEPEGEYLPPKEAERCRSTVARGTGAES